MKPLFLLLAFLYILPAEAKEENRKTKLSFQPEHEFFLGVGVAPLPARTKEKDSYWGGYAALFPFEGDTYMRAKYTSGVYFLGYSYRVKRWLSLCVSVSYATYWQSVNEYYTDRKLYTRHRHYFSVAPSLRFSWLRKKWVQMYSTLGVGVTFKWDKHSETGELPSQRLVTPDVVVLGISVGKDYYGFIETGPSHRGAFNMGIGYRFKHKENKR